MDGKIQLGVEQVEGSCGSQKESTDQEMMSHRLDIVLGTNIKLVLPSQGVWEMSVGEMLCVKLIVPLYAIFITSLGRKNLLCVFGP